MTRYPLDGIMLSGIEVRPAGPPRGIMLALHGGGYRAGYWHYPEHSLLDMAAARGYLAIAVDRPGYGAAQETPLPLARQAEVMLDLIARLRVQEGPLPVFLVGHSMGGILALTIAALPRANDLVAGVEAGGVPLRLVAISRPRWGSGAAGEDAAGDTHLPPLPAESARSMYYGPAGTYDEAAFEYAMSLAAPVPYAELPDALNAGRDLPDMLRATTLPIRLSFAEHEQSSVVTPDVLAAARAALAGSLHAVVRYEPATGHNFSLHHVASAYHRGIIDWCDSLLADRPA